MDASDKVLASFISALVFAIVTFSSVGAYRIFTCPVYVLETCTTVRVLGTTTVSKTCTEILVNK